MGEGSILFSCPFAPSVCTSLLQRCGGYGGLIPRGGKCNEHYLSSTNALSQWSDWFVVAHEQTWHQWRSYKADIVELIHGFSRSKDPRSCEPAAYPNAIWAWPFPDPLSFPGRILARRARSRRGLAQSSTGVDVSIDREGTSERGHSCPRPRPRRRRSPCRQPSAAAQPAPIRKLPLAANADRCRAACGDTREARVRSPSAPCR